MFQHAQCIQIHVSHPNIITVDSAALCIIIMEIWKRSAMFKVDEKHRQRKISIGKESWKKAKQRHTV